MHPDEIQLMSLESFFHEIAMRQASADRDHLRTQPPWWKRHLSAVSRTTKQILVTTIVVGLGAAGVWLHQPLQDYLGSRPDHPTGAADVLTSVVHRALPLERAHRRVLACAREDDAYGCMEALWTALNLNASGDSMRIVVSWLRDKEVQALRVNAFFDRYAAGMEEHPDQVHAPTQRPKISTWFSMPDSKGRMPGS